MFYPDTCEIQVDDTENNDFLSLMSDISVVYGMDSSQNELTELGQKALAIYDNVLYQIQNNE